MSPVFATRRRAEEFDAVVDGTPTHAGVGVGRPLRRPARARRRAARRAPAAGAARVRRGAARRAWWPRPRRCPLRPADERPAPAAHARPGRVRNPRERRLASRSAAWPWSAPRRRWSVVAQSALPGDVLYPLKRGIESAQAGISVSDEGKGTTLLASASDAPRRGRRGSTPAGRDDGRDRRHPRRLHRAGHRGLRPAARVVRRRRATTPRSPTCARSPRRRWTSLADLDGQLPDERPGRVGARGDDADAHRRRGRSWRARPARAPTSTRSRRRCPPSGTGFGTGALPALNLPDVVLPTLVLPSLGAGDLPPGSVTKPSPTAGPGGGPTTGSPRATRPRCRPAYRRPASPTTAVPTAVRPTAAATSGTAGARRPST